MSSIEPYLRANRLAVLEFLTLATRSPDHWMVPLRPGKWSPAELVEHLSITFDESRKVVLGAPSAFPSVPRPLRPVLRALVLRRVNRSGRLPNGRTPPAFSPGLPPPAPAQGRARLERSLGEFEDACGTHLSATSQIASTVFGRITLGEFVRFQEVHVRHHAYQVLARSEP